MNSPASHSLHVLPEIPKSASTPSARSDNLKLLLVDPDPRASAQLEQLCRELLGDRLAQLATADSVEAAAARVATTTFDVVLLDPQSWGTDEAKVVLLVATRLGYRAESVRAELPLPQPVLLASAN